MFLHVSRRIDIPAWRSLGVTFVPDAEWDWLQHPPPPSLKTRPHLVVMKCTIQSILCCCADLCGGRSSLVQLISQTFQHSHSNQGVFVFGLLFRLCHIRWWDLIGACTFETVWHTVWSICNPLHRKQPLSLFYKRLADSHAWLVFSQVLMANFSCCVQAIKRWFKLTEMTVSLGARL